MAEIRKVYHEQLDDIDRQLVEMGGMVVELIPRGTEILLNGDLKGAEDLIIGDDKLDLMALDIDEKCTQVMSRQQPMAVDLRSLVAALHLVNEIERSGDLVVNIAKGTRRLHGLPIDPKLRGLIERMGNEAQRLFKTAMDAYVDRNEGLAAALDDMDDTMDELHGDFIQALFESRHAEVGDLQPAIQLALIGRYYERIGDHAVNIGERVIYLCTGWLPEHTGAAREKARTEIEDAHQRHGEGSSESGNGEQPEGS
jgi:phosphate transport system protein